MDENSKPWNAQWNLVREIDRGGQGIVSELRSLDDPTSRAVLKEIVPKWRDNQQAKDRLRKEAEILAQLHDLGAKVPAVYDSFAKHPNSEPFLLMEFIPGDRFDEWLRSNAPVSPQEAVCITKAIAETIVICHENNIGHRDLKPANIILRDGDLNSPYVLDFGICFDSQQTVILTREGETFWNEFITLPECQDLGGGHRDLRSDITALAGVFFSCLTGRPPIVLRDAKGQAPHRRYEDLLAKSAISVTQSERLMWFFEKGFAYSIADRFQSMGEFTRELARFADTQAEERLDPTEEFEILSRNVETTDRSVQLVALNQKFKILLKPIDAVMGEKLKEVTRSKGNLKTYDVRIGPSTSAKGGHTRPTGDRLGGKLMRAFTVIRQNFRGRATVLLVGFAVGMDIHLYAAGLTSSSDVVTLDDTSLEWSRIAVIEESKDQLGERSLKVVIDALSDILAHEIRNLNLSLKQDGSNDGSDH